MAFDYAGAKAAGYNDQEIQDYLKGSSPSSSTPDMSKEGTFTGTLNKATISDMVANPTSPLSFIKPLIDKIPGATTKAYDVPVAGGIARGLSEPLAKAAEYVAEPTIGTAQNIADNVSQGKSPLDPSGINTRRYMSPGDFSQVQGSLAGATAGGAGTGLQAGLDVLGIENLPGLAVALKNIPKFATTGSTYKQIESAANAGKDIDWQSIVDKAMSQAKGKSVSVQKALGNLIAEETPSGSATLPESAIPSGPGANDINQINNTLKSDTGALFKRTTPADFSSKTAGDLTGLEDVSKSPQELPQITGPLREPTPYGGPNDVNISNPTISSSQALDLRKSLGSRLPQNFFENLNSRVTPQEQDAINILRRTVSGELKKAAPEISTPDQVYSFYKKIHGDAPTWAKRIIAIEALKHLGNQIPGLGPLLQELPLP